MSIRCTLQFLNPFCRSGLPSKLVGCFSLCLCASSSSSSSLICPTNNPIITQFLISSVRIDKRSEQDVHEQHKSHHDTQKINPQRRIRRELRHQRRPHREIARIPRRRHHRQIQRIQHHAQIKQTPLPAVLRRDLQLGSLLRVRLLLGLLVLLLRVLALDAIRHPEPRDHVQHHVDRRQPVVARREIRVAVLRSENSIESYRVRRSQQRAHKIKHGHEEERGGRKQAAVEFLGETEAEAGDAH